MILIITPVNNLHFSYLFCFSYCDLAIKSSNDISADIGLTFSPFILKSLT